MPWYEVAVDLSNPVVRKSAHDLTEAEGDRVVAAWRKMTENKKGVPGSSEYFRLGVVHGGTQDRGTWLSEAQNPTPSYCVHGPECFANWHRIYITDMELTLRRADLALGNDGRIGLPYFDWTVKPAGKPMLPMVLQKIMATDSFEGKYSEGGLFHDTFLPLDRSGNQMAPREQDGACLPSQTHPSAHTHPPTHATHAHAVTPCPFLSPTGVSAHLSRHALLQDYQVVADPRRRAGQAVGACRAVGGHHGRVAPGQPPERSPHARVQPTRVGACELSSTSI